MRPFADISFYESLASQPNNSVVYNAAQSSGQNIFADAVIHNAIQSKGKKNWAKRGLLASILSAMFALGVSAEDLRSITDEEIEAIATECHENPETVKEVMANVLIPSNENMNEWAYWHAKSESNSKSESNPLILRKYTPEEKKEELRRQKEYLDQNWTEDYENWSNRHRQARKEQDDKIAQAQEQAEQERAELSRLRKQYKPWSPEIASPEEQVIEPDQEKEPWHKKFHQNGMKGVRSTFLGKWMFGDE